MNKKIIRWSPLIEPFEDLEKSFSDFLPSNFRLDDRDFLPAVDMYEEKNNVIVETDLAGIDTDDVDISIDQNVLTIKGEGEKRQEVDEKNYYKKEIRRGSFYRNVQLPTEVDGNKAEATAKDGVLKITIPKAKQIKSKSIKIKKEDKK